MRGRYVHRVGAGDVGRRVTLRHGDVASPRDTVGRLVAHEDGVLVVTHRDGSVSRVPDAEVLASRTLPEHPRLPPEPRRAPDP